MRASWRDWNANTPPQQITTILYDCDNTLVLSEVLAFAACADLANTILRDHKVAGYIGNEVEEERKSPYTGSILMSEFVGQNFRGMLLSLCKKHNLTLTDDELQRYVGAEEDAVIAKINSTPGLQPCSGVFPELDWAKEQGFEMAVVSSSALRRVNASLQKAGMDKYFGSKVFSAATSLPKPTSKPDPAIYKFAVEKLGKTSEECVAVEDSKSGTLSAVRAGLKVVGYVGCYEGEERREMEKTLKENGAGVVMGEWGEFKSALESIAKAKL